jgi:hypothetical protein
LGQGVGKSRFLKSEPEIESESESESDEMAGSEKLGHILYPKISKMDISILFWSRIF